MFGYGNFLDMLVELSRREEEENIKADPDIDMYMKVSLSNIYNAKINIKTKCFFLILLHSLLFLQEL